MMTVKRFEGVDLQQTLRQVEAELGPDAVVLQTRRITEAGVPCLPGAAGKFRVEVLAAVEPARRTRPRLFALCR